MIRHFNPPSPCGEGQCCSVAMCFTLSFQSTLPVWGGTVQRASLRRPNRYFNPPSPCGEGLGKGRKRYDMQHFNPPSPCGEGPVQVPPRPEDGANFNPPSPCGEGRADQKIVGDVRGISIHPPRVGRDPNDPVCRSAPRYFNPPSPCGEGLCRCFSPSNRPGFQSTLPVWGGTPPPKWDGFRHWISIHPPRVGRDWLSTVTLMSL